jgi:hypothetical protein
MRACAPRALCLLSDRKGRAPVSVPHRSLFPYRALFPTAPLLQEHETIQVQHCKNM